MNAFFIGIITFTLIWNPCTALSQTLSKPLPSVASTSISTKTGEVIGASGRIGSFLLGSDVNHVPVPRNEDSRPGSFTEEGCPIYVAIPATQIPNGENDLLIILYLLSQAIDCLFYAMLPGMIDREILVFCEYSTCSPAYSLAFVLVILLSNHYEK